MAGELLTRADVERGKKNFDAFDKYLDGDATAQVMLPSGKKIKTRAGVEADIKNIFGPGTIGLLQAGSGYGQVPLVQDVYKAAFSRIDNAYWTSGDIIDCNMFSAGSRHVVSTTPHLHTPPVAPDTAYLIESRYITSDLMLQMAWGIVTGVQFSRVRKTSNSGAPVVWSEWKTPSSTSLTYNTTTATSANVVVTATGELQRSTSSKIFKKDIEDISISDYRAALKSVRPVSYRSTDATADRTDWSWYSFIAEELAAIDKRLVQMSSTEFFEDTDEDGKTFIDSRELPEGEYAANGINTNGIVALMVHVNQQMLLDIETLESEKTQLKTRMTKLEKRLDALEQPATNSAK